MNLQSGLVYGPVRSRRLGTSLGVNLSPQGRKTCNFNCAYCQYGWTDFPVRGAFPSSADVIEAVDRALVENPDVDTITVAGNGEPTLHPEFARIAEGLFHARAQRAPKAKLALLSNGSTLDRIDVKYSLSRFGVRCMKLMPRRDDLPPPRRAGHPAARLLAGLRSVGHLTRNDACNRRVVDNTLRP